MPGWRKMRPEGRAALQPARAAKSFATRHDDAYIFRLSKAISAIMISSCGNEKKRSPDKEFLWQATNPKNDVSANSPNNAAMACIGAARC
jgi:hypothetical protein